MTSEIEHVRRSAWRFFWGWLILASAFSISANVAHAVLLAAGEMVWMTAAAAVVPPCVQIAATHSISLLVRTRANGWAYWSALGMTLIIGAFAFVLSFDAIRALAVTLGFTGTVFGLSAAAIFPLAIDVSITHATLCLLAQTPPPPRPHRTRHPAVGAAETRAGSAQEHRDRCVPHHGVADGLASPAMSAITDGDAAPQHHSRSEQPNPSGRPHSLPPAGPSSEAPRRSLVPVTTGKAAHQPNNADDPGGGDLTSTELLTLAEQLVHNKVTTKRPELVYDLLADGAAGMRPTAIATKHNVHHSVVRKVLKAAALAS